MHSVRIHKKRDKPVKIAIDPRARWRQGQWLLGLALFLAFVSYLPTLKYGFVFDDVQQIVENPAIKSWIHLPQYFTAHVGAGVVPKVRGSFFRPLFLVWLRLNYVLFDLKPWGWHLANLLLHLTAVAVFFLLVRKLTQDGIVAGWAAVLFALHPIHIEAVAWISAVPEIQFSVAGMAAIYLYLRYRQEQRIYFFYFSLVFYVIALLAKETAVVIWPLIAACDQWFSSESRRETSLTDYPPALKRHIPFAAITAAYFALRIYALHGLAGDPTHTFSEIICSAPSLTWFYLQKLVAPFALSQIYFYPEGESFVSAYFTVPLLAVVAVTGALIYLGRKSKHAAFASLLIGLSLVPPILGVSVFPRHDLVHNRYAYLPSAGICLLLALGLRSAAKWWKTEDGSTRYWHGTVVATLAGLILIFSIRAQEQPYRDNIALLSSAVELAPESAMAWGLLGEEQMTLGRYSDGIASFRRAQTLDPELLLNNYRLGAAYYLLQDMPSAEVFFQRAVDSYHDRDVVTYDYALYRLGLSQYAQGKMPQAENTFRHAIQAQPKGFGYHLALGAALKYEGNLSSARQEREAELKLGPDAEASALLRELDQEMSKGEVQEVKAVRTISATPK